MAAAQTGIAPRNVIANIGRSLISLGVLILLFVAYQLWGTGLAESRNQEDLRRQLSRALVEAPRPSPGAPAPPATPTGEAVAIISIPKIGVEKAVVEGVSVTDLQKGPGHYPDTPMPGEPGNAAIAGHRTTYGAHFYRLDEHGAGDLINVTTRSGRFRYEVVQSLVVPPSANFVLENTPDNRLTLTTCHPRFSAAQRLIVIGQLTGPAADPPPEPREPRPPTPSEPEGGLAGEESAGLSGESSAKGPALAWGALAGFIWFLAWWVGRRWKRWPAYVLGAPVFLVVLFLFFENFARLLPANI